MKEIKRDQNQYHVNIELFETTLENSQQKELITDYEPFDTSHYQTDQALSNENSEKENSSPDSPCATNPDQILKSMLFRDINLIRDLYSNLEKSIQNACSSLKIDLERD